MKPKIVYKNQPDSFKFSEKNLEIAENILKKYPKERKKKRSNAFTIFSSKTK